MPCPCPSRSLSRPAAALPGLLAAALVALASPASAVPVVGSAGGVLAAAPGGTVGPQLRFPSLTDFEAADLFIVYDPLVLSFSAASVLDVAPANSQLLAGPGVPDNGRIYLPVSYIVDAPFTGDGGGLGVGLLQADFSILAGAAYGTTTVRFETRDAGLFDLAPLDVTVTVMQPVPEPSGLLLGTLGLVGLGLVLRRRRPGT